MSALSDPAAAGTADDSFARADATARERADRAAGRARAWLRAFIGVFRDLSFILYLVLAMLAIWLWMLTLLVLLVRVVLHSAMALLLWLAGGKVPRQKGGAHPREWFTVLLAPVLLQLLAIRGAARAYWYWPMGRKAATLLLTAFCIALPLIYTVPRPNYVQVVEDNALRNTDGGLTYLVHAVELFGNGTKEYTNEPAWWLLKFDEQVITSKIHPGRFYKLWVVGIRWQLPATYPNIIGATEVDRNGNPLPAGSHFIPVTTSVQ
jgi:hypothetical protein